MRAESAVDPTRSENITVTWRRSAVSCGCGATVGGIPAVRLAVDLRRQHSVRRSRGSRASFDGGRR